MLSWAAIRRARRPLRVSSTGAEDRDDIPLHTRNDNVSNSDSSRTLNASEDDIENATQKSPVLKATEATTLCEHAPHDNKLHAFTFEDWWIWELAGLIGCLAALIAIIVILAKYDHQQQPQWSHISLNALLSWLSTIAKACALIPITKGLSQLKWVWFAERERSLGDLRTFDAASRGVVGSFELLWRLRGRHLATFGSLGIILALGSEPFVQNLVHYYPQNIPSETEPAFLANATFYDQVGYPYSNGQLFPIHASMKFNILSAVYSFDSTESWGKPQYICRTGDCTWDFVSTLAFRSQCQDISDKLTYHVEPSNYADSGPRHVVSWPGNANNVDYYESKGQNGPTGILMTVQGMHTRVSTFRSIEPMRDFDPEDGMEFLNLNEGNFVGTECKIMPCIRSFRAIVSRGIYREEEVEDWCAEGESWPLWTFQQPPWGPERGLWPGSIYSMNVPAFENVRAYLQDSFLGYYTILPAYNVATSASPNYTLDGNEDQLVAGMFHRKSASTDCEDSARKLECTFAGVAAAITKSIRDAPHVVNGTDIAKMARGKTLVTAQFVHVKWVWMALPVLVWLLSAATSVGTAWKTRRAKVQTWRNNPLPLLFLYGESDNKSELQRRGTSDGAFVERAEGIKVQLHVTSENARLIDAELAKDRRDRIVAADVVE